MTENGWIPVTERLPEDDRFCMITVNGKYRNITFEDAIEIASYYEGYGWVLDLYPEWDNPNVTAWQPLPAPYERAAEPIKPSGWQEQMTSTFLGDSRL